MRFLLWFTIGFGTACGFLAGCVFFGLEIFGLLSVFFLLFSKKIKYLRYPGVILLGMLLGGLWCMRFDAKVLEPLRPLDGTVVEGTVTAQDFATETEMGQSVDGTMLLNGKSCSVRLYLDATEVPVEPGMEITGSFLMRMTTPGSLQGYTSHSGSGVYILLYAREEPGIGPGEEPDLIMKASFLRKRITQLLEICVPADALGFAKALLLGDTSGLSYEVDTHLKVSGIRHVAAVSGLHVSILFALVGMLTLKNRFASAVLGLPVLLLFAALAGFTPSVSRACIMCALMLGASLLNREYDGLTALSFAVLVMLLQNPLCITSVSLQLSVASVAGIFLFAGPVSAWFKALLGSPKGKRIGAKLRRGIGASAGTTLGAMVFTVPLCAWYFGTVSLIGILTNLLTLWVISFIFYGLMAACAVYLLNPAAGIFLGRVTAWAIRYVLTVARILASAPLACVYTESEYVVFWLVCVYILLVVFLLAKKKEPVLFVLCAAAGLLLAMVCSWTEPMLWDSTVTVLDVGQGQCILLESEGRAYLVDCGGDSDTKAADKAAAYLFSRGIFRLDGVILTHLDRDHAGGVGHLLSRVDTELLILPPEVTALSGEETVYADRPIDISWENSSVKIFSGNSRKSGDENNLCILLDTEKCDILITGDCSTREEERLVQAGLVTDVDVLIAGHHGSKNATSQLLLEAASPEIVCISVGADNSYGHPSYETLRRLAEFGCSVFRTDHHGTITIRR